MKQQLKTIIPLSLALFVLVSYQFIAASSVWSPAPSTPPNPNADMPIHTGATQNKSGGLGVGSLAVYGNTYTSGYINNDGGIEAKNVAIGRCPFGSCSSYSYESIQLPSGNNLRLWFGGSQRYVFYNNGHFVGNWIQANNQMRSNYYCDVGGGNCTSAAQIKAGAGTVIKRGTANISKGSRDGSGNGNYYVGLSGFSSTPTVTITPKWTRYSGDEDVAWWVTEVSASGFRINWHGPQNTSGSLPGENGVMWTAIGS